MLEIPDRNYEMTICESVYESKYVKFSNGKDGQHI